MPKLRNRRELCRAIYVRIQDFIRGGGGGGGGGGGSHNYFITIAYKSLAVIKFYYSNTPLAFTRRDWKGARDAK